MCAQVQVKVVQKLRNALSSDITAVKESERMLLVCLSVNSWSCSMQHQSTGRVQLSMSRESSSIWVNRALYSLAGGHPDLVVTIKVSTSGGMASICGTVASVSLGEFGIIYLHTQLNTTVYIGITTKNPKKRQKNDPPKPAAHAPSRSPP